MKRMTTSLLAAILVIVGSIGLLGFTAAHDMATPTASPMAGMHGGHASGGTGAVYFRITNTGTESDRLISAATSVAHVVEIHEVKDNNGVKEMRPLENGLEIPAGETIELAPGGYHIMMIGLTRDLMAGMFFESVLSFENAGDVAITVPVRRAAPEDDAIESIHHGDLVITGVWSRPAPALLMGGAPEASPVASPTM